MNDSYTGAFDEVAEKYIGLTSSIEAQIRRRILGQNDVVRDVLLCLVGGGHILLEGVPGLGKTELLKSLAQVVHGSFSRIQFTPDLMPADIVGTQVIGTRADGHRSFEFREGPVFANLVLADEINRATPKSQSALLEAMQEHQVTVAGETRPLPQPFMVLATQNPIELEGTYPLPEAQLDRFMMKSVVSTPEPRLLAEILDRTTNHKPAELETVCGPNELRWLVEVTRQVPIASPLIYYVAMLVSATHPNGTYSSDLASRYVRVGASPRGGQSMILCAKARALMAGRPYVNAADVQASATAAMRHRLILGYEATADGIDTDQVIAAVLQHTAEPNKFSRSNR